MAGLPEVVGLMKTVMMMMVTREGEERVGGKLFEEEKEIVNRKCGRRGEAMCSPEVLFDCVYTPGRGI